MADIRINALATTAASTASDDFIAVDGSANGTRKLNAYSPTFGGNLTVSGTAIASGRVQGNELQISGGGSNNAGTIYSDSNWGMIFKALQASPAVADFLFLNSAGTERARITSTATTLTGNLTVSGTGNSQINGNLGIGAAPSAWQTLYGIKAIDLTNGTVFGATNDVNLAYNSYFNSSNQWIYKDTKAAGRYTQNQGVHEFFVAASGTAGNQITWTQAMTLNLSGNLLIGTTTDGGQKLQVSGTGLLSANLGGNGFVLNVNNVGGNAVLQLMGSTAASHLRTLTNGSLNLITGGTDGSLGTTALTLDSSQNATFAGTIAIYGASTADTLKITRASNTANGMLKFITTSTEDWIVGQQNTSDSDFHFYSYGISGDALKLERSTGNATFAGNVSATKSTGATILAKATSGVTAFTGLSLQNKLASGAGTTVLVIGAYDDNTTGAQIVASHDYSAASRATLSFGTRDNAGTLADALSFDVSRNATFAGNIKTAAPSGGTAATWRLGTVASVSPTSPNRTIEVEIGGTTYYIHAKTTNN